MKQFILTTIALFALLSTNGQQLTTAEYFWGTDPGSGNGIPMAAFDGNFNQAIETIFGNSMNVPAQGTHTLSLRTRDALNNWGPVFTVVVNVAEPLSETREIKVTSAEYFFNDDPGPGNGTPMLAVNGDFSSAIEQLKGGAIPAPIQAGIHVLWMRARDAENNWGPKFGVVVNMDTTITGFNAEISGLQTLCTSDANPTYSTQITPGSTYNWTVINGELISGQGTTTITVNWNAEGPHSVQLEKCLGTICEEDEMLVTINPTHTTESSLAICFGESVFLGGTMQSESGIYTDIFENQAGCDSTVHTTLTVLPEIALTIEASATEVCAGESVTLTASGADSFSWSSGINNGQAFTPTETTTYTVTGTTGSCSATATILIEVNENPEISIEASVTEVCTGESVTLTASGADSFSWSYGINNGQAFTPTETTTYTVTGTTGNCSATATVLIEVNENPEISIEASTSEVCAGEQVTLTASGANEIIWSNGIQNSVPFSPNETQTYSVIGTSNGCSSESSIEITVNPLPVVTISGDLPQTVCIYAAPVILSALPDGGIWSGPGVEDNLFEPEAAGVGSHILTYTFADENECTAESQISITVDVCTSVDAPEISAGFQLYPNPTSNICWIETNGIQMPVEQVVIYDAAGRIVETLQKPVDESTNRIALNTGHFAPGTYVVHVIAGNEQFRQRLVITR